VTLEARWVTLRGSLGDALRAGSDLHAGMPLYQHTDAHASSLPPWAFAEWDTVMRLLRTGRFGFGTRATESGS
jgi:hypothetical protein